MKPENLKYPFIEGKRRTCLHQGIWFVADKEDEPFHFPGWEHEGIFTSKQPVKLEFCSGNGLWISQRAHNDPNSNWVGIEIKFSRIQKIWSKIANLNLKNLLPVCGEAFNVSKKYIPDQSVQEIFINFPDPWPKRRHSKYRLIQDHFVDQLQRILVPGGITTLVTDDLDYSKQMIKVFNANASFSSLHPNPYYKLQFENYGTSYFENLWRLKGKEIRFHQYQKKL